LARRRSLRCSRPSGSPPIGRIFPPSSPSGFAVEPRLLILDEPFTSLDQPLAARLRDELALLVDRRPVTTLLVTHDLDEAARLADRLFLLSARPARILATMPIGQARAARTAADIAAIKAAIAQQQAQ
jgi:ABC-type nitrate/sulfonate/bicarbonate transport system ATPase subunit